MLKLIRNSFNERNLLIKNNKTELNKYLLSVYKLCSLLGGIFLFIITVVFTLTPSLSENKTTYIVFCIGIASIIFLFNITLADKYPLLGTYVILEIFILFSMYLSVVSFADQRATALLAFFCIAPFFMVDNSIRSIIFILFNVILHTVLAYFYKKEAMYIYDFINCFFFSFFSLTFASILTNMQLKSFELQRLLEIERVIDVVTGLKNRRKLFEDIKKIELKKAPLPSTILMLDIDFFKKFNDTYGHSAGDKCLASCGGFFNELSSEYNIACYRYGGEEFTIFLYDVDENQTEIFVNKILENIRMLDNGIAKITTSIGYVMCNNSDIINCEKWIEKADEALYQAKESGRDRAVAYRTDEVTSV